MKKGFKKDKATYIIGIDPYCIDSTPDAVVYKFDRKDCQTVTTKGFNELNTENFEQFERISDYYNAIPNREEEIMILPPMGEVGIKLWKELWEAEVKRLGIEFKNIKNEAR